MLPHRRVAGYIVHKPMPRVYNVPPRSAYSKAPHHVPPFSVLNRELGPVGPAPKNGKDGVRTTPGGRERQRSGWLGLLPLLGFPPEHGGLLDVTETVSRQGAAGEGRGATAVVPGDFADL